MKTLKQVDEFKLIDLISRVCKTKTSVVKGIGDDTAVVRSLGGRYLLYTTDMLIEDVHFKQEHSPLDIGHKAIACSISDIAAMGGIPEYALVSIGIPKTLPVVFVEQLYKGMQLTAQNFGISVIGGDTNRSDKIIISVFLGGSVPQKEVVFRDGARERSCICVTGKLGGSGLGRHLSFVPRVKEARCLVENYKLQAMIDISDGLVQDLSHILKQSNVGALVYEDSIPLSSSEITVQDAYGQGEDFELLFVISSGKLNKLKKEWPFKKTAPLSCIGEIRDKKFGLKVKRINGKIEKLTVTGFRHF